MSKLAYLDLDTPLPIQAVTMHPLLVLEPGANLVIHNASIILNEYPYDFYSRLCAAWLFSRSLTLDEHGLLTLSGQHATKTGLLLKDSSIRAAAPGGETICHARAVGSEAELWQVLDTQPLPNKRLYLSLARNITINQGTWSPISLPDSSPISLLGDPERPTQIDFGGIVAFLYLAEGAMAVSLTGIVAMRDLLLVNMLAPDVPTSVAQGLVAFAPPFFLRRQVGTGGARSAHIARLLHSAHLAHPSGRQRHAAYVVGLLRSESWGYQHASMRKKAVPLAWATYAATQRRCRAASTSRCMTPTQRHALCHVRCASGPCMHDAICITPPLFQELCVRAHAHVQDALSPAGRQVRAAAAVPALHGACAGRRGRVDARAAAGRRGV